MAFTNNPFAQLILTNPSVLEEINQPQKFRLCELIKDVSDFEPNFDDEN
jgi:hypothetical protein